MSQIELFSTPNKDSQLEVPEFNSTSALEEFLLKCRQAYYFGSSPIVDDAVYDALEAKLKSECPTSPIFTMVGCPVPPDSLGKPAKHRMPMGSQDKVHTQLEAQQWVAEKAGNKLVHASFKGDGGSIGVYYEDGKLTQVITRGDGYTGEEITANAAGFKGLPLILAEPITCSVRCEAIMTLEDFDRLPTKKKNPRNSANGILGRLDGTYSQYITVLAFDIEGPNLQTEEEKTNKLKALGFTTPEWVLGDWTSVARFQEETDQLRKQNKLPYWIDGIVLKINQIDIQQQLGIGSGNKPRGQVAWKFEAEGGVTQIQSVEWAVGHSGAITPVAKVDPVDIGGTTISNVSLANPELIKTLGVQIGSKVLVVKAGDIIPQISQVLSHTDQAIPIPTHCPACSSQLTNKKNVDGSSTVVLYCESEECPARSLGKIKRWAGSLNILGLGDSVIQALLDSKLIQSVADCYTLNPEQMQDLTLSGEKVRLGERRAKAICEEIRAKATKLTLAEFLGSFGTRSLGKRRATLMREANQDLCDLENWLNGKLCEPDFAAASGVPLSGKVIFDGLKGSEVVIRQCLKHVTLVEPLQQESHKQTVCITGSLPSGKKKSEYKAPLEKSGYTLVDDVSKELSILVVSDPSIESSKSKKAKKLGIKIISEQELLQLLSPDA